MKGKNKKGISIIAEILLAIGVFSAAVVFSMVGYRIISGETQETYYMGEISTFQDLANRLNVMASQNDSSIAQYRVTFPQYVLKSQGNVLSLKTPGRDLESTKVFGIKVSDFEIQNSEFICIRKEKEVVTFSGEECLELKIPEDFCSDLKCVDGVCTPEYGERCISPDCACENDLCFPNWRKKECLDERGCVLNECVGVKNETESCDYTFECAKDDKGRDMKCKPAKIDPNNKACCPPDEVWNGTHCTIGCTGDFCETDVECGTADQCNESEDLECHKTIFDINLSACCPDKTMWDGTECRKKYKGEQCEEGWECGNDTNGTQMNCNPTMKKFKDYDRACCDNGNYWNGTACVEPPICPEDITRCYNKWHWNNYGGTVYINKQHYLCDIYETCHPVGVKPAAKETIECCDNKCSGSCHSLCNKALKDSGLSSTDTPETRKKCYGLYVIYGLSIPHWMTGYKIHIEQPASIMLTQGTWMCTGYAIVLTTLLRSVGYSKNEAYGTCAPGHMFNMVKFPGESGYRFADTVGNSLYISGMTGGDWYGPRCSYGQCGGCSNDEGVFSCPSRSQTIGRGC